MATLIYAAEGGSITHSISEANLVSVSITAPVTDGNNTIMSFDGTEVILFYIKDSTEANASNVSPSMTYSSGAWSITNHDASEFLGFGITSLKYTFNVTYGPSETPANMTGDLAELGDGPQLIVDLLTEPPVEAEKTVTTSVPIGYSVQPINTYVRVPVPNMFSFSGGISVNAGDDFGLSVSINNNTTNAYPNIDPISVPVSFGTPGYTGIISSSSLVPDDMEELFLGYSGNTYSTGVTFTVISPALNFDASPSITAGETAGTLVLTFGNANTTYTDTNYPVPIGVGPDPGIGGNMVSNFGEVTIHTGPVIVTDDTVTPGMFVVVGYQSTSAITAGETFGTTEYFLSESTGITLAGITYTTISNQYVTGEGPQYGFNNLSVMGQTGSGFVESLYLTTGKGETFGVTYGAPKSTVQITGVTHDISGAFLSYSAGGNTLDVPDFALPLTGSITVTTGDGTVTISVSGAQYGDSTEFTLHSATSPFSGSDITVASGSGSAIYTGLTLGTSYNSSAFTLRAAIPTGYSANSLTSLEGIIVGGTMAGATGQLILNHVFTTDAGQTFTFNILGESGYTGITYGQTVTLDVPVSTMNTVLAYASNWPDYPGTSGSTGTQPQPAVALMVKEFLGYPLDDFGAGLTGTTSGDYGSDALGVITGDQGTTCTSLLRQFQLISGFTYHAVGGNVGVTTDYLSNIPQEAITSFTLSSVDTTPLTTVIGNLSDVGDGAVTTTPYADALQSLFEQAVNAGMVQGANQTPEKALDGVTATSLGFDTVGAYFNDFSGTTATVYGVQWTAGQELALYVEYDLTKKRTYQLSPDVGISGAAASTVLNFGGVTFELAGLSEESTAVPVTYKIVLHTVADQL